MVSKRVWSFDRERSHVPYIHISCLSAFNTVRGEGSNSFEKPKNILIFGGPKNIDLSDFDVLLDYCQKWSKTFTHQVFLLNSIQKLIHTSIEIWRFFTKYGYFRQILTKVKNHVTHNYLLQISHNVMTLGTIIQYITQSDQ